MLDLIMGNAWSLVANVLDALSASRKKTKSLLLWQCASQLTYGIAGIVLKGYSATVQNVVSILRNLAAVAKIKSKVLEWCLVAAGVALGLVFNNRGVVGLLPVIANLEYSLAVFRFQDNEAALKAAMLLSVLLFTVFNVAILNIVGAVANFGLAVVTAIFLVKAYKRKKEAS